MQAVIAIILIIVAICVLIKYRVFFIIAAILGLIAFISVKYYRKKKREQDAARESEQKAAEEKARQEAAAAKEAEVAEALAYAKAAFAEELDAIPAAAVTVSDPAPRQLLKDMPEFKYCSVTAKTRLTTIFPLVFVDVETTGLYPSKDDIIEVSAIRFEAGMVPTAKFTTFCSPRHPIPAEATAINHITDDMVEDAPAFRTVAPALSEFIKGCNLAGHNLEFDIRFLYSGGVVIDEKTRCYDTLDMARNTIRKGDILNYKLPTLCSWYGIWRDDAHRSLSDCYATAKVFTNIVSDKTGRALDLEGPDDHE